MADMNATPEEERRMVVMGTTVVIALAMLATGVAIVAGVGGYVLWQLVRRNL